MEDEHRIRRATPADALAAAEVHCEAALVAYRDIFPPESPKPTPQTLLPGRHTLFSHPDTTVLVVDSPIEGVVAVARDDSVPSGWALSRLYVRPASWGGGLGAALHDAALDEARDLGTSELNLWVLEANHRARQMYERRGWTLVPDRTAPNDAPGVLDVLYRRDLRSARN